MDKKRNSYCISINSDAGNHLPFNCGHLGLFFSCLLQNEIDGQVNLFPLYSPAQGTYSTMNNMTTKAVVIHLHCRVSGNPHHSMDNIWKTTTQCISMNKHKTNLPFRVVHRKNTIIPGFSFEVYFSVMGLV